MTDLIDRIDALVDEQMADGEPENGFDFGDPDYPGCPHCHRQWHGLRITKRIETMRWTGFDPEYSYSDDDSLVLCEGSDFIGPRRPPAPQVWVDNVATIRIVPSFRGLSEHLAQAVEQWRGMFQQLAASFAPVVNLMQGAPWLIQFRDRNVFSGRIAFDELYGCAKPHPAPVPEGITVEFGPQNWIHEMRRIPPALQFPRPWPRLFSPTELAVRDHWQQLSAPSFPVPDAHGYDFTRYANEPDPIWVHRPGLNARTNTRPAHTTARQRRHGRTRR
ncbi:hypothetical protein [Mycolicibacterium porcinum]